MKAFALAMILAVTAMSSVSSALCSRKYGNAASQLMGADSRTNARDLALSQNNSRSEFSSNETDNVNRRR